MTSDLTTHPDYRAFMAAILAEPDEDLPRLAFADWLEERGDSVRSEFVRVQCNWWIEIACICGGRATCVPCELRRRERELLNAHVNEWSPADKTWACANGDQITWSRGFVSAITMTAADWLLHAGVILTQQPIREVTLTGLRPERTFNQPTDQTVWVWWKNGFGRSQARLPPVLWELILPRDGDYPLPWDRITVRDYPDETAALAALTSACERRWPALTFHLPPIPADPSTDPGDWLTDTSYSTPIVAPDPDLAGIREVKIDVRHTSIFDPTPPDSP